MNSGMNLRMRPKTNLQLMLLGAWLLMGGNALANEFHPEFPLLDKAGQTVIQSGNPLSMPGPSN